MKNRKRLIIWSVVGVFFAVIIGLTIWGNTSVGLNTYTITDSEISKEFDGYRIALISDVHNSRLWEKALKKVEKADPDIVVITGDLVDRRSPDVELALSFVFEMMKLTKGNCFYVTGNHEMNLPEETYAQLMDGLKTMGVTVMDDSVTMLHNGTENAIALVGHGWGDLDDYSHLTDFEGYKILLAHDPFDFEDYAAAGFDLVLSGHTHGGQVRLPFAGGVYFPDEGLFPKYDGGEFTIGDSTMVVSRGIGNSAFPIRFLNRPEVVIIEFDCA